MNFRLEILANFEFWGYQICRQTVHEITKFHSRFLLKSKREGKNSEFLEIIGSETSEKLSTNKNKLNAAFDNGFYSK